MKAKKNGEKSEDILNFALQDPDYGSKASISELVDQAKTFFFAGHDTTAGTLSWVNYFLYHHPAELDRLRKELDDVFGTNTSPHEVAEMLIKDPKLHNKLEFTLAVIKETLRLEGPASSIREGPANYCIRTQSGATMTVPDGALLYVSAWYLQRNEKVWGKDAKEFKPGRFMSGKPIPWGYIAFSKRPRDCIGTNLAYLEVILTRPPNGRRRLL